MLKVVQLFKFCDYFMGMTPSYCEFKKWLKTVTCPPISSVCAPSLAYWCRSQPSPRSIILQNSALEAPNPTNDLHHQLITSTYSTGPPMPPLILPCLYSTTRVRLWGKRHFYPRGLSTNIFCWSLRAKNIDFKVSIQLSNCCFFYMCLSRLK